MPVLTGQITQTTENIEIYLTSTGSNLVDNFNINVYKWDTGSSAEYLAYTYATGVTPTTLSDYNNKSLEDGYPDGSSGFGYGISGLTFDTTKVELVTSGSAGHCQGGSQSVYVIDVATGNGGTKGIYNPGSGEWTYTYSGTSNYYSMYYVAGSTTNVQLTAPDYPFKFTTLPWSLKYPYDTEPLSNFDITHIISKIVSNNQTVTGSYVNGPLQDLEVVQDASGVLVDEHLAITARQKSGITQFIPSQKIRSTYRVTWTPSGNYLDVDFYWETDTYQL